MNEFKLKVGEIMNNYRKTINPCCQSQQVTTCTPCGLVVTSTSNVAVARLCSQVTYTVRVCNESDVTARNAILTVPLDGVFALLPNTVTVNGQVVQVENLSQIPLGDIEPSSCSEVTYQVVVMEAKRYVYTRALVTCCICCCLERKVINTYSNLNLLQVCPCCNNTSSN